MGLAWAALGVAALAAGAPERLPDDRVVGWADKQVKDWQPRPAERRFDEIGWAKDLRTARQLAEKHRRPVFVFTMDGRINIGRC
jgi:hypothetical protein